MPPSPHTGPRHEPERIYPVGEPDPVADSDPYLPPSDDDEADRASGVRGTGQGAEDR